jgi:hypothetical protein
MSYDLTESRIPIQCQFWLLGNEDRPQGGVLHLKAGKSAQLDTVSFKPLDGKNFFDTLSPTSKKIIYGLDQNGKPLTLLKCLAGTSNATMASASQQYACRAAIFGEHIHSDDLNFKGIRLRLDHIDSWVGRSAFAHYKEYDETGDGGIKQTKITIPIAHNFSIPLSLPGYSDSKFFSSWSMSPGDMEFRLSSKIYLDLFFHDPLTWADVEQEAHRWEWFFSLATRRVADIREFALYRTDDAGEVDEFNLCDVWIRRRHSKKAADERRRGYDYHFTFSDVEKNFSEMIGKWNEMQKSWAAVLHRFFATSHRQGLWLNEEFLFLAQAVESIHRVRSGDTDSKGVVDRAAKQAYLNAPIELQEKLGDRGKFIRVFRKTRNYWTHYGEPTPETDPEVLGDIALHDLNQKLRWIVESSILKELGVPENCVSKVWSPQWTARIVEYE